MSEPFLIHHEVFPGRGGSAAVLKQVTDTVFTGLVCDCMAAVHSSKNPLPLYGRETGDKIMARAAVIAVEESGLEPLKRLARKINDDLRMIHGAVMKLKSDVPTSKLYGLSAVLFQITPAWVTLYCWGDVRFFGKYLDGTFFTTPDLPREHELPLYPIVRDCFRQASEELGIPLNTKDPGERERLHGRMWEIYEPLLAPLRDAHINVDPSEDPAGYPVLNGQAVALEQVRVFKFPTEVIEEGTVEDDGLYEDPDRETFDALPEEIQAERVLSADRECGLEGQVAFLDDQDAAATEVSHVRGKKDRAGIYFRFA